MLLAKRILVILMLFLLAGAASFVLAAEVNINATIVAPGSQPPQPTIIYGCTDPAATNYNPLATVNNGTCVYNIPPVYGCTDSAATNYNPLATQDDGSCVYDIYGCTDSSAINYNPAATIDDGSCQLPILGCTDSAATNYNPAATVDDGSCIIAVCTDSLAVNYDPAATSDDGSCLISGCTDPTAVNYNPEATIDNGLCSHDATQIPGCTDSTAVNYNFTATIDNGSCAYLLAGCTDKNALNYDPVAVLNNGSCVYPLPIIGGETKSEPAYYFSTNNNGLQLFLGGLRGNNLDLLVGHELLILAPANLIKAIKEVSAVIGEQTILFDYDSQSRQYFLKLDRFNSPGKISMKLSVVLEDGSVYNKNIVITVHELGRVFSKLPADQTRLFGIGVFLYDQNNKLIVSQSKISEDGTYGFMVANGRYKLTVFDNGQKIYDGKLFDVKNNIVNKNIGLSFLEQVLEVLQEAQEIVIEYALDNPAVEETVKYSAPPLSLAAAFSTFLALPWTTLVSYFQLLFTEPLAWLFRRRKKGWGVVYNSITKQPVDLAVVRLSDQVTGRLLKSRVTDKEGRYNFLVEEGNYILEAVKSNMDFPSKILKDQREDSQFVNLYHGETITITQDQKGIITANIPLDPLGAARPDEIILRQNFWYKIKKNISVIGPVFSILAFIIYPSVLMISFVVVHLLLYSLFQRLARREKIPKWGIILDAKTGQPVARSVAKIYSPQYDKMLEAQVTDRHGRYGFLAGNNIYYLTAVKEGYAEAKTANIDLTHKKSSEIIGQNIKLQPLDSQVGKIDETKTWPAVRVQSTPKELDQELVQPTEKDIITEPLLSAETTEGEAKADISLGSAPIKNLTPELSPWEEVAEGLKEKAEKTISDSHVKPAENSEVKAIDPKRTTTAPVLADNSFAGLLDDINKSLKELENNTEPENEQVESANDVKNNREGLFG